jgi:hypothetical protein
MASASADAESLVSDLVELARASSRVDVRLDPPKHPPLRRCTYQNQAAEPNVAIAAVAREEHWRAAATTRAAVVAGAGHAAVLTEALPVLASVEVLAPGYTVGGVSRCSGSCASGVHKRRLVDGRTRATSALERTSPRVLFDGRAERPLVRTHAAFGDVHDALAGDAINRARFRRRAVRRAKLFTASA